ncbi:unnamed protein product [Soboliphyme baturini]|uniref:U3 small nucleolar RNA-associated protein 14 homolog A n=1 Tax=Soboliphyme baturini TaxID=241478 RepID=A0A183IJH8_9BILA|nr:unnamed protein product [Soboliphyme baturini]
MEADSEKRLIRLKPEVRSEPNTQISELNLTPCSSNTIGVDDLISAAKSITRVGDLKQLASEAEKNATLEPPLHRQLASRLRRKAAYENISKELNRWDPIVRRNRVADHLDFPQNQITIRDETPENAVKRFVARTPLEIETTKLLQGSKHTLHNDKMLTEAETEAVKVKMSIKEAHEKLNYLRRMRALVSYQEAKFKRQKRIKGKQYHRLLKRGMRQKTLKEFEELIATDPKAALEKWNELERDRIMERALLKHRGTGKWAKQMRVYQKRDPKVREALQEQFRLSRELAEKVKKTRELEEAESFHLLPVFDAPGGEASAKDESQAPGSDAVAELKLQPMLAADLDATDDEDDDQEALIAEAFADDDVVADFQAEVEAQNADKAEEDPEHMPGWNRWTGPDIVSKKRKKNSEKPPDSEIKRVSFNLKGEESVKRFQVSSLPFPYTTPDAFEAKLSCPLGREWNPETVFTTLNQPSVTTKMGTIIKPLNKDQVLQNRSESNHWKRKSWKKRNEMNTIQIDID